MKKLLLLSLFFLLSGVFASIASNAQCWNTTTNASITCNTAGGWVFQNLDIRTSPSQSVNFSYKFETVYYNSEIFNAYTTTRYSSMGGFSDWNCSASFVRDTITYYMCKPKIGRYACVLNITMFSSSMASGSGALGYKYPVYRHFWSKDMVFFNNSRVSNANDGTTTYENNNANRTYIAVYNSRCENIPSHSGFYRPYVSLSAYVERDAVGIGLQTRAFLYIDTPVDTSIVSPNFTVSLQMGNLNLCDNATVYSQFYNDLGYVLDERYNTSPQNGVWNYSVSSYQYGKPFFLSPILYCNSSAWDFETHQFSISLNNITPSATNGSILKNIYQPLCFYTPLPESVCNVTTQNTYVYVNNVLYYNLNSTNETVYCVRDRSFDGCVPVRVSTYCSNNGNLITTASFNYCFQYQIKYIAQDFSGFVKGVMPPATNFILMFIIVGLIVAVFGAIFNAGVSSWKK